MFLLLALDELEVLVLALVLVLDHQLLLLATRLALAAPMSAKSYSTQCGFHVDGVVVVVHRVGSQLMAIAINCHFPPLMTNGGEMVGSVKQWPLNF